MMEKTNVKFKKYLFVCEFERPDGSCCSAKGTSLREILKQKIKDMGLSEKIRVSRSGCQDSCAEGPNILMSPDHIHFKRVVEKDIDEIIQTALKGIV